MQHYPVKSIREIGVEQHASPWDLEFARIGTATYTLNHIEHEIIRKEFQEPRIHFAVNCASFSCPKLRREAFISRNLDKQLTQQAEEFINNRLHNQIFEGRAKLSKLFEWFAKDFTQEMPSVASYINQYSTIKLRSYAQIEYIEYDWSLNQN